MSSRKREAVRVVLMDTQFVETDPMSFKSVVQNLTGRESSVAWIKESNPPAAEVDNKLQDDVVNAEDNIHGSSSSVSVLLKGMSFKDLDRLILEVPPPEELQWLWTEYNLQC